MPVTNRRTGVVYGTPPNVNDGTIAEPVDNDQVDSFHLQKRHQGKVDKEMQGLLTITENVGAAAGPIGAIGAYLSGASALQIAGAAIAGSLVSLDLCYQAASERLQDISQPYQNDPVVNKINNDALYSVFCMWGQTAVSTATAAAISSSATPLGAAMVNAVVPRIVNLRSFTGMEMLRRTAGRDIER